MSFSAGRSAVTATRTVAGMALVLTIVSVTCFNEPLSPVVPSWDVDLTLPLANRYYSLLEIVRKEPTLLTVGAGNQIIYSTTARGNPILLGEAVTLTPPDTTVHLKFGVFSVTAPSLSIPLDIPWLPRGATIPVPDTTFSLGDIEDTIATFQSVTFDSGAIHFTITNNLPVPIEMVDVVRIEDRSSNIVASFSFVPPTIPANSARTASDDLRNKTFTNIYRITGLTVHTPGSISPVQIPSGDLLVAGIQATGLKARQAVQAFIPPQRLVDNDTASFELDDSTLVKEAYLLRGRLDFSFVNHVNLDMVFAFRLREVQRPMGSGYIPYADSVVLPALGSGIVAIDLSGARIQSPSFDLVRSLNVVSSVILPAGSSGPVTVNDTDKVSVSATTGVPLVVDTAEVVLAPTWVDVNTAIDVDFGDLPTRFSGQLTIPFAPLTLQSISTIGFASDLDIRIGARRSPGGDSIFLQIPQSQRRLEPGIDSIVFDGQEVGFFLSQLGSRLPDSLSITGRALVNPPDLYDPSLSGASGAGRNSSITPVFSLQAPLRLGINSGVYSDTVSIGDTTGDGYKDYQINKARIDDVNYGKAYIEVENGLPVQLGVDMRLLDSLRGTLLLLPQSGLRVNVTAASVDAEGNVILPANSTSLIELGEQDVRQFSPAEFLAYSVALMTTPGSPAVRFRTNDYVKVRMWTTLSYRVNK